MDADLGRRKHQRFERWLDQLAAIDRKRLAEWNSPKFEPLRRWLPALAGDITSAHIAEESLPTVADLALLAEWFIPAITAYENDARVAASMVSSEVVAIITKYHTELRQIFEEFAKGGKSWGWLNGGRLVARKSLGAVTVH